MADKPAAPAQQPTPAKPRYRYRPAPLAALPPELGLPPATIQQVMTATNASARTVWRKIHSGVYRKTATAD